MQNFKWIGRVGVLAVAISLVGCEDDAASLQGAALGDAIDGSWHSRSGIEVQFKDGALSAFAGCNRIAGQYVVEGDQIDIREPLAGTRMACIDDDVSKRESEFLTNFPGTYRAKLNGERLRLVGEAREWDFTRGEK